LPAPADVDPLPSKPEVPPSPEPFPIDAERALELQIALARRGISTGPVDGLWGSQTRAAVAAFQRQQRLPDTGVPDDTTLARLGSTTPLLSSYRVTSGDLARLRPLGRTWLAKSQQDRLEYETVLELVAERCQAHPNLLRRLNPSLDWTRVAPGAEVTVPKLDPPPVTTKAASVRISLGGRCLQVFDSAGNLVAYFPCSIGRTASKWPVGRREVKILIPYPDYTFNPEVFPESEEGRLLGRKLVLPPGPNNPVGTAWIGLDKPGYGIHGTPIPELVGRTGSHGCFRLANWNAELLLKLAWVGLPVQVEP
jgi:lipoprotein-anchoring transpeptidase ErfK/SrfK